MITKDPILARCIKPIEYHVYIEALACLLLSAEATVPDWIMIMLQQQGRRMSQRSSGKRPRYAVDLSDEGEEELSGEGSGDDDDSEGEDEDRDAAKVPVKKRAKPAATPLQKRPVQQDPDDADAAAEPGPSRCETLLWCDAIALVSRAARVT